jgi:hypothetical protein
VPSKPPPRPNAATVLAYRVGLSLATRDMDDSGPCNITSGTAGLTEEEVARILCDSSDPDHFAVLRRRGRRPLSDEQAAQILQEKDPAGPVPPLPIAERATTIPVALPYRGATDHAENAWMLAARIPPPWGYRILRLVLWLAVAALTGAVIYRSAVH